MPPATASPETILNCAQSPALSADFQEFSSWCTRASDFSRVKKSGEEAMLRLVNPGLELENQAPDVAVRLAYCCGKQAKREHAYSRFERVSKNLKRRLVSIRRPIRIGPKLQNKAPPIQSIAAHGVAMLRKVECRQMMAVLCDAFTTTLHPELSATGDPSKANRRSVDKSRQCAPSRLAKWLLSC
jgi:hypothetical protein